MYKAKDLGKNQYFYYNAQLDKTLHSRLLVNNQLKNAINNEELDLYFQPQLNLKKGTVNRAEALLRWNQNDSVISPLKFISIAEDSKLIEDIDLWVIIKTIDYIKQLIDKGYSDFLISLNMSGRTFTNKFMMSTILNTLKESNVASYIEIEITEGVLIENIIYASEIINKMKNYGISISLDDFGTGYSSFSYLSQLPIDTIKIDRSFISQLHKRRQEILVDAIISFSNKLGILVVAEGVEKQDQIAWLKEKNCDYLQGFIFSNPLTFSEFEKFFYAHEQSI